jgi:hypothetical protein
MWSKNNRPVGDRSSETSSHPIDKNNKTNSKVSTKQITRILNSYPTDCSRRDSLPSATVSVQFQGHLCIRKVTWAAGRPSKRWLSLLASGWMTGVLFPAAHGFCFQHIVQTGFGGSPSLVCNSTEFLPQGKEAGA